MGENLKRKEIYFNENEGKGLIMIKNWLKKIINRKRTTPDIESLPHYNKQHKLAMRRPVSIPTIERRISAARGVEPNE